MDTEVKLPRGFKCIEIIKSLKGPRFLTIMRSSVRNIPCGTILVAERKSGQILAVNNLGRRVLISGLNDPTSIYIYRGSIYIGESDQVSRYNLNNPNHGQVITKLPTGGRHQTKTVLIHNDKLYVSIGSSCNSCVEKDPHRAVVMEFNLDGSNPKIFSSGLRNSVGLAVNPWTHQIWASTNGRDDLGDQIPPDTIDILHDDTFYGWPYCHGGSIPDPDLHRANACLVPQPVVKIQAHSAPLGLVFYDPLDISLPRGFDQGLYVALHGSWNRSKLIGYSILFIPLDNQGKVSGPSRIFAQWPVKSETQSISNILTSPVRPVGLAFGSCGLYMSDDSHGSIYLISKT